MQNVKTQKQQNQIPTCPICRYGISNDDEEISRLKTIRENRENTYSDSDSNYSYNDNY